MYRKRKFKQRTYHQPSLLLFTGSACAILLPKHEEHIDRQKQNRLSSAATATAY